MTYPQPRIGPYLLERRLGVGGMGETYVALRRGPGEFEQRVCLKRIRREVAGDPDVVRQFLAEARIAAQLRHTTIAQVLDFGQDGDDYFLTLELIEGADLRALLEERRRLPVDTLTLVATDVLTALDVAHRAGIVHRDVSPSNVLLSTEGEVKLADFGIARPLSGPSYTASGIVRGKVPYLAPDYARSGAYEVRCDLFSLGVMLYECASGERPYDGATDLDTLERAARGQHAALSARAPDAPEALCAIIERLIDPEPSERFASAAAVIEALSTLPAPSARVRRDLAADVRRLHARLKPSTERLAPELTRTQPAEDSGATRSQLAGKALPRERRVLPRAALAASLLFLLAVGVVLLLRGRSQPELEHTVAPALEAPAEPRTRAPAQDTAPAATAAPPEPSPPVDSKPAEPARSARRTGTPRESSSRTSTERVVPGGAPATLEVVVVPYGHVRVDGRKAEASPLTLRLKPGAHTVVAQTPTGSVKRAITLEPAERRRLVLR